MFRILPTLVLAVAGSTSFLVQEPGKKPDAPSTSQGRGAMAESGANGVLAAWILSANRMEVELARIAEQKATDPAVKAFAQKMVADHGALIAKLQAFAAQGGKTPAEAAAGRPSATGDFDVIGLVDELSTQHLQTVRAELEKKQGADFDRCYMGMALMGHLKANDVFTVFTKHATGDLQAALKEGQKTVQGHLQEARTLSEKFEKK